MTTKPNSQTPAMIEAMRVYNENLDAAFNRCLEAKDAADRVYEEIRKAETAKHAAAVREAAALDRVAELERAYENCSIERRDAEHAATAALDRVAELEGALRILTDDDANDQVVAKTRFYARALLAKGGR